MGTGTGTRSGMKNGARIGLEWCKEWLLTVHSWTPLSHLIHVQHFQKEMRGIHEADPDALIQKALKIKYNPKKLKKWVLFLLMLVSTSVVYMAPVDDHVTIVWLSCDYHVTIMWLSCDHRVTIVTIIWLSYDYHMIIIWLSCDQESLH